jgi:gliding-associated putative ABC transporter substrate-binding component GldG
MTTTSTRRRTLLFTGVVLAILVLVNIISIRIFGRLDMTEQRLFTLADASKDLMASLDDKVTVNAYFTEDLPSPYSDYRRAVLDILNEFRAYSGGNLQFTFINPEGEKGDQEAARQGIAQAQVQVVKEDQFEAKRAYMGLVFLYEDRKEVIPIIQSTSSLEYDIASTIRRLTVTTRKRIAFSTGHGEPQLQEFGRVMELMRRQYDVTAVDLAGAEPIPQDVSVLIIAAPTQRFGDAALYKIDQHIMRGGRVGFLLNKVEADLQQRFGRQVDFGLEPLLETYGLRINQDLVRDAQCANISIVQQQAGFSIQSQVPYPSLPLVSDFSADNVMVKDLKNVVLFFASSVDTLPVASRGLTAEVLLRTSKQSGRQRNFFLLDPLQRYVEPDFGERGIPLAAVVSGSFTSHFAGKPAPEDTTAGAMPQASPVGRSTDTRVVLFGDGDFARDQFMGGNRDNMNLLANIVDYLADDAGLITIRSKEVAMPPLEQVADGTKKLLKYGNLVLPPALVLVFGLVRWRMRASRRKALEAR